MKTTKPIHAVFNLDMEARINQAREDEKTKQSIIDLIEKVNRLRGPDEDDETDLVEAKPAPKGEDPAARFNKCLDNILFPTAKGKRVEIDEADDETVPGKELSDEAEFDALLQKLLIKHKKK